MIGTGSWVATRNAQSARLYVDQLNMQRQLQNARARRRRELFSYLSSLVRKLLHRRK